MTFEIFAMICLFIIGKAIMFHDPIRRFWKRAIDSKVWKGSAFWFTGGILVGAFAIIGLVWGFLAVDDVYIDSNEHLRKPVTEVELTNYFYAKEKSEYLAKASDSSFNPAPLTIPQRMEQWKTQHESCCINNLVYSPLGDREIKCSNSSLLR